MTKLLYIHPLGLEGADMEHRADLAHSLGFDVLTVPNEPFFSPGIEAHLEEFVTQSDCVGVWADIETDQLKRMARRLLVLAGTAEKPLLGRQRYNTNIIQNLTAIIGFPMDEQATNIMIDDENGIQR